MVMRSWVLKSWPEVQWEMPDDLVRGPVFQHMGTEVRPDLDELGRAVGETVWAARLADGQVIGAAWEWVEVLPGVPAIRDPNGIISNLRLVGEDSVELEELQAIVGMNRIAHAMPWQQAVMQSVRAAHGDRPLAVQRSRRKRAAAHAEVGASSTLMAARHAQAGAARAVAMVP
jgi:hypothetical protein